MKPEQMNTPEYVNEIVKVIQNFYGRAYEPDQVIERLASQILNRLIELDAITPDGNPK